MMNQCNLTRAAGALLILSSLAAAQSGDPARIQPITSELKHGGTYHVSTKTWTRNPGPTAALGPHSLYTNDCVPSSFWSLDAGESLVDSGLLPDTSATPAGTASSYTIDGLEVAYCTSEAPVVDLQVSYFAATPPGAPTSPTSLLASLALSGAPGASSAGTLACWIITIDLGAQTIDIPAGSTSADNFAWEFLQVTPPSSGPAGPILAGDPLSLIYGVPCEYGAGTAFLPGTYGTGLGSEDLLVHYGNGPSWSPGAVFLGTLSGGYPTGAYLGLYHQMFGDASLPQEPGVPYCNGGPSAPCPCGNANDGSAGGAAGCRNTNNSMGGVLRASGAHFAPPPGHLVLEASNAEPGGFGLFFQGLSGISGAPFGDGLRCVAQDIIRLQIVTADAAGEAKTTVDLTAAGGVVPGTIYGYQYWYRNVGISACGAGFNFSNGYRIP
jgi:hypothetical protein